MIKCIKLPSDGTSNFRIPLFLAWTWTQSVQTFPWNQGTWGQCDESTRRRCLSGFCKRKQLCNLSRTERAEASRWACGFWWCEEKQSENNNIFNSRIFPNFLSLQALFVIFILILNKTQNVWINVKSSFCMWKCYTRWK